MQPFREPLRATLLRNGAIALALGLALSQMRAMRIGWTMAILLALWPSFGGHWIEILFLNWLRPRLSPSRRIQVAARLAVWFTGGIVLLFGMKLTASLRRPAWWIGGIAFIAIELVAHATLQLRGRPSFYNGRG
jgi:hypothetical protein